MYYVVNDRTNLIMESYDQCPDPQREANYFGDPVYIVQGQHTGLTASPQENLCEACQHLHESLHWCMERFDVEQINVGGQIRNIKCTGFVPAGGDE